METFSLLTIVKNVEVWIFAMVIVNGAMAIVFLVNCPRSSSIDNLSSFLCPLDENENVL